MAIRFQAPGVFGLLNFRHFRSEKLLPRGELFVADKGRTRIQKLAALNNPGVSMNSCSPTSVGWKKEDGGKTTKTKKNHAGILLYGEEDLVNLVLAVLYVQVLSVGGWGLGDSVRWVDSVSFRFVSFRFVSFFRIARRKVKNNGLIPVAPLSYLPELKWGEVLGTWIISSSGGFQGVSKVFPRLT